MKEDKLFKRAMWVVSIAISLGGAVLIGEYSTYLIPIGMILMIWGNNIWYSHIRKP